MEEEIDSGEKRDRRGRIESRGGDKRRNRVRGGRWGRERREERDGMKREQTGEIGESGWRGKREG